MKCECGTGLRTIDSRKIDLGVWRRRVCPACGASITTLEQRCDTVANPYRRVSTGEVAQGQVTAPAAPPVPRPQRPRKDARPPSPDGKFSPAPADFAPPPEPKSRFAPHATKAPVDRVQTSARDRIEDLRAERAGLGYGWEK